MESDTVPGDVLGKPVIITVWGFVLHLVSCLLFVTDYKHAHVFVHFRYEMAIHQAYACLTYAWVSPQT